LEHPLLRGAGVRSSTHSIRIARFESRIAQARTKLEVIRVLSAVDRVYWRLYAAREQLEVRKQQYDLAESQRQRAQRLVEAQKAADIEVIRAESAVAERQEAIILADNAVRDCERDLKRILNRPGLAINSATILITATPPDPVRYRLDSERLIRHALLHRLELVELELQLAQDASTIDYQRNGALPLVNLAYTYNINGLGPTSSDAYDLMLDNRFVDHYVGLTVQIPLGNQSARSQLRQAILQRQQRLATRSQRLSQIEQEVLNASDQLEANWQRILASRQSRLLAARTLQAEQRHFELGLQTSTELLDAQTRYADARTAEILALTEYQIAQVDLAYATGSLLGAARVEWITANDVELP
ncbi:MAG: TolC family protein, partial [Sedimentisphaerales bacterium]|nr:TolC family protein [Sedimentisphaerales bacterium]